MRGAAVNSRTCLCIAQIALVAILAIIGVTGPAIADKRVALVIGNSAYQNVARLDNPRNDAVLMADTLGSLGFVMIGNGAQLDLDKPAMDLAVQNFGRQIQGADVALFYYAGHGVQVSGSNYLVPVGANPTREADVDFQMVDVNLVLRQMQGSGTRLNMVILDACRNNPFGARGLRSSDGGLAQMRAPEGTLISYATQPGNVAQDGSDGHSPYTKALATTVSDRLSTISIRAARQQERHAGRHFRVSGQRRNMTSNGEATEGVYAVAQDGRSEAVGIDRLRTRQRDSCILGYALNGGGSMTRASTAGRRNVRPS